MQKQIFSATVVYSILTFLQPFTSLVILQPFYLHHFTSDVYGILSLMGNYTSLVSLLSALSLHSVFFTFYYDYHQNEKDLRYFFGQLLSFTLYSTCAFMLLMCFAGEWIFDWVYKDDQVKFYPYGFVATMTGIAYTFFTPFIIFLRNKKMLVFYALLVLATVIVSIAGQVVLVSVFNWGLEGALIGKLLGVLIGVVVVLWYNKAYISYRIDWSFFTKPFQYLKYSFPDLLLNWAYASTDRLIIERLMSLSFVGVFSLLNILTGAIEMAYFAVRSAILPFLYEAFEKDKAVQEQEVQQLYTYYIWLLVLAISGIILIVCNLHFIITKPSYLAIRTYVFIYALGYLFSGINMLTFLRFYYIKDSKTAFLYSILLLAIMLALNFLLIPIYKLWGAVSASFLSKLVVLLLLMVNHRTLFKPFYTIYCLLPMLGIFIICLAGHYITQHSLLSYPLIGMGQFVMVLGMLTLVAFTSKLLKKSALINS